MDSDHYTSEDEHYDRDILIKDIPNEVIRLYENGIKNNKLNLLQSEIVSLLNLYDINRKISDFENQMICIYENIIANYLYRESPGEILDANSYNLPQKFLEWVYSNTDKGIQLEYLEKIYISLN